jgi:hypothetical protein
LCGQTRPETQDHETAQHGAVHYEKARPPTCCADAADGTNLREAGTR